MLVDDTLTIECLIERLTNYLDAKNHHDTVRDEFVAKGGYSWGYHGHSLIERMNQEAKNFADALDSYIDQRIALRLEK